MSVALDSFHYVAAPMDRGLPDPEAQLPKPNSLRRAHAASRAAVALAAAALRKGGVEVTPRVGAYVGEQQIPLDYCAEFIDSSYRHGPRLASPMLFSESVANNAATHLSLTLKMTGPLQTFIGSRAAGIQAVMAAREDVESGVIDAGLVVVLSAANRLSSDAYNAIYSPHARARRAPPLPFVNGGAAFLVRREAAPGALALEHAAVRVCGRRPADQERALRGLWQDFLGNRPAPARVGTSFFCLERRRAMDTLRKVVGAEVRTMGAEGGEALALDPFLGLFASGPWAGLPSRTLLCLGEDGTAALISARSP
jgi:hypothetical protein